VTAQQPTGISGADAAKAWLQGVLAQSPSSVALGRKVARHIRRLAQPAADDSPDAQQRPRRQVPTCKAERDATGIAPKVPSDMPTRPRRCPAARPPRRMSCAASPPCEIWTAGIMEKHWRFQLARPPA
jgi:hypothetical protein